MSKSYGLAWNLSTRPGQGSLRTGQSLPPPEYFPVVGQHRAVAHWGPKQIWGLRESSRGVGGPKAWTAVPVPDPQSPVSHIWILPPCQVPLVETRERERETRDLALCHPPTALIPPAPQNSFQLTYSSVPQSPGTLQEPRPGPPGMLPWSTKGVQLQLPGRP